MNSLATMDTAKGRSEDSGNGAGGAVNGLNDRWKRLLAAMTAKGELETIARASSAVGEPEGIRTQMGTVQAAFEFPDGSAGAPSQTARERAKERIKGISVWRMARSDYSGWQVVIMGERESAVDKGRRLCVAAGGFSR